MSLDASEFAAEAKRVGEKLCMVGRVLGELDAKDRKVLEGVLDDRYVSPGAVANVLDRKGHDINTNSVAAHRRRTCSCYRQ